MKAKMHASMLMIDTEKPGVISMAAIKYKWSLLYFTFPVKTSACKKAVWVICNVLFKFLSKFETLVNFMVIDSFPTFCCKTVSQHCRQTLFSVSSVLNTSKPLKAVNCLQWCVFFLSCKTAILEGSPLKSRPLTNQISVCRNTFF